MSQDMWDIVDRIALQRIAQVTRDLVVVSDEFGRIVYANESFYRRTGYTESDVLTGKFSAAQLYMGGMKEAARVTRRLQSTGIVENYRGQMRVVAPIGYLDVNLTLVAVPPLRPKPSWIIGINKDIFEIERLLTEIGKLSEDKQISEFGEGLHNLMLCLSDRLGHILYCNQTIENTLGYKIEELLGTKVHDYLFGGVDEARSLIAPVIKQSSQTPNSTELRWHKTNLKHKNGHPIAIRIAYKLYYSGKQGASPVSSILGISQDMSHTGKTGFLSHSSVDKSRIRRFRNALEQLGIQTWIDEHDLPVAGRIPHEIAKGIERSDLFFFCMTPASVTSSWCLDELDQAVMLENKGDLRVIPILLDNCEIPSSIRNRKYANFASDPSTGLLELIPLIRPELRDHAIYMALQHLLDR